MLLSADTMAVPPCYADLGKSAKDIFNKGYGRVSHNLANLCWDVYISQLPSLVDVVFQL